MKNCDRDLENAARGHRSRVAFLSPRSQFFNIRTDAMAVNNLFIFPLPQTSLFLQLLTYSRHTSHLANTVDYDELNVLKNNFISTMPFRTFLLLASFRL